MQMYGDLYVAAQKGYMLQVVKFCCFLTEVNILALTRSSEIHILTYFDLKSRFLTYALHEMKIFLVFKSNQQPCSQALT